MKGTIEYTRKDGKIDGGNIVEAIEMYGTGTPSVDIREDRSIVIEPTYRGKIGKYVVAIAEVD